MKLRSLLRLLLMCVIITAIGGRAVAQQPFDHIVVTWNKAAIQSARNNNARGLLMVRALAIMHTAMFDAWTEYDSAAIPTMGHPARRPEVERTLAEKREAISYAAYCVLLDLLPGDGPRLEQQMAQLAYDPAKQSRDPA